MAGRNKIFDEKEVIEKAIELFWSKGYEATSTEDLLSAMGIGKGSFYHSFPGGKKELFEKALEQFNSEALLKFKEELAASARPIEVIREFFMSVAHTSKEIHQKGCFLGNSITEMSNIDAQLKNRAIKLLRQLEHLFSETIKTAQEKGQLKTKESPEVLARHLITAWNGLNITRRMYTDTTTLKSLIEIQLKILH